MSHKIPKVKCWYRKGRGLSESLDTKGEVLIPEGGGGGEVSHKIPKEKCWYRKGRGLSESKEKCWYRKGRGLSESQDTKREVMIPEGEGFKWVKREVLIPEGEGFQWVTRYQKRSVDTGRGGGGGGVSQGFKVLLSFLPLGARKRSYIRTRHSFGVRKETCRLPEGRGLWMNHR